MLSGLPDINCEVGPQTDRLTAYNEGFHDGYNQAMSEMPEIVRCKDCSNGELDTNFYGEPCVRCYNSANGDAHVWHKPDWYCPYGEVKH